MSEQTGTGRDVKSLMNWFRTRFKVVGTWLFIGRIVAAWPKVSYPAGRNPLPFFLGIETILLRFLVGRSIKRGA